jgi:hypothetical protein
LLVRSSENLDRAPEMYSRTTPKSKDERKAESRIQNPAVRRKENPNAGFRLIILDSDS